MSSSYSKSKLIPAMILGVFTYGLIAALLGTVLPELGERFNLTAEQSGLIATMQALGLMIASVAIGPIVDNRGKKTGIVAGLSGITLGLIGLIYAGSYPAAAASMLVLGLGGGMLVTGSNALISDVSEGKRASALNLLNMFFGLGTMVTPLLAANVAALSSTHALSLTLTAIAAVTLLVNIGTKMPPPTGGRGFTASEAPALLKQPTLYLLCSMLFLYVACEVGVFNWLVKFLEEERSVARADAQNILSWGFALGLLIGRVAASRILLGVSEIKVTLAASVVMTVTTFAMVRAGDPTVIAVAVFAAGLAMAPMFPTTLGVCGNLFTKMTATAMGIVITSGWVGLTLSSYVIGFAADRSSLGSALLLLPVMSVALIGINLALRRHVEGSGSADPA